MTLLNKVFLQYIKSLTYSEIKRVMSTYALGFDEDSIRSLMVDGKITLSFVHIPIRFQTGGDSIFGLWELPIEVARLAVVDAVEFAINSGPGGAYFYNTSTDLNYVGFELDQIGKTVFIFKVHLDK